jgi:hypothetical protein
MGTLNDIKQLINEASKPNEISGYIDFEDPLTKENPENPQIVIIGIGKLDYKSLQEDVQRKTKDLFNFAKKGNWKFMYKTVGKIHDYSGGPIESPYQAYIRTLIQVEEKMASGSYKRRITMAKRKR